MKRTRTTTSLFLTVSALLVVFQGCNTSTDLQPVPQNSDGGSAGTGGSPVVGPGDTGGSNTTSTTPGNNTGGAANNGTGGAQGNPQGGGATGGTKSGGATGGAPSYPTGGAPSYPTGGAGVNPTGGAPHTQPAARKQTQLAGPRAWQRRRVGHRCRVEDRRAPGIRARR